MRIRGTTVFSSLFRRRYGAAPRWTRIVFAFLVVPLVLAGGGSGAYYLNLHRLCSEMSLDGLSNIPEPVGKTQRILVLSPHCDDETLGAGGLIADARRNGVPVRVAFFTNGDGFPVAASRTLREVELSPSDYVRFAQKRQEESIAALHELGVGEKSIDFMGYPDRGLKPMWEDNWDKSHLYRSAFTGHTHVPYPRAYSPQAAYCGEQLKADLVRLIREYRPTDIYVTHPSDDHPDHHAAAAFAQLALKECQATPSDISWAKEAQLRYYIVHRGDWPLPQGTHPDLPLLPPPGMVGLDTKWSVYPVTAEGQDAKYRALSCYISQLNITRRFLTSFRRTNELFGSLPVSDCAVPDPNAIRYPTATIPDARGDNVARYADPAADLTGYVVQRMAAGKLQVRIRTRGPVSPRVRYRVLLRVAAVTGKKPSQQKPSNNTEVLTTRFVSFDMKVPSRGPYPSTLEAVVSLRALGIPAAREEEVWVSAETRWAGRVPVDRMGYGVFPLTNENGDACQ